MSVVAGDALSHQEFDILAAYNKRQCARQHLADLYLKHRSKIDSVCVSCFPLDCRGTCAQEEVVHGYNDERLVLRQVELLGQMSFNEANLFKEFMKEFLAPLNCPGFPESLVYEEIASQIGPLVYLGDFACLPWYAMAVGILEYHSHNTIE